MNTNTDRDTTRATGRSRARRMATLSVAGVLAGLALAPASAFADHPTSGGAGTSPSGDKYSYLYDVAQRKEVMARDRVANAGELTSDASATTNGNPWSYMYTTNQDNEQVQVARHRIPPAKARHDSPQRKAHPALANIVVSVSKGDPATCYLPDTVDPGTRRLIAIQLCGNAHIVPAVFLARAAYYEPAYYKSVYSLGHL
jgi:hypothetical protein